MRRCPVFCLGVWGIDFICSHLTWLCHPANMINSVPSPSSVLGCCFPWLSASLALQSCWIAFLLPVVPPKSGLLCLEAFSPSKTRSLRSCWLQLLHALEKPECSQWLHSDLKLWDTFHKSCKYHFSCLFFPTQNKLNLCCKSSTYLLDLLTWASKCHRQNLDKNAEYLRPGYTNLIVQCLLNFHFSIVMLSWKKKLLEYVLVLLEWKHFLQ